MGVEHGIGTKSSLVGVANPETSQTAQRGTESIQLSNIKLERNCSLDDDAKQGSTRDERFLKIGGERGQVGYGTESRDSETTWNMKRGRRKHCEVWGEQHQLAGMSL
jgi:hypothetical protein